MLVEAASRPRRGRREAYPERQRARLSFLLRLRRLAACRLLLCRRLSRWLPDVTLPGLRKSLARLLRRGNRRSLSRRHRSALGRRFRRSSRFRVGSRLSRPGLDGGDGGCHSRFFPLGLPFPLASSRGRLLGRHGRRFRRPAALSRRWWRWRRWRRRQRFQILQDLRSRAQLASFAILG